MIIGVPKELKNHEYRILSPEAIKILTKNNHSVLVESGAGIGSGFSDDDFKKAGALITNSRFIWLASDIIVKVKEPLAEEMEIYKKLSVDWPYKKHSENALIIFGFFHFPANPEVKKFIIENKIRAVPYENIQLPNGSRPILSPISKITAEICVDVGAHYLRKENVGKGILLKDAAVLVIGSEGSLGGHATKLLKDRGTIVFGVDKKEKIATADNYDWEEIIKKIMPRVDLIICAPANKGERAPKLITREMLKLMQPGSVIVDPSIDEGGCCETSRPTTHDNPVFTEEGIIHYCVSNMPGVVPRSSTPALVKEALPYILEVANKGWEKALKENEILCRAAKID